MTTSAKNIFEEKKLGKAQDFKLLKKLYPFIKPYRYQALPGVVCHHSGVDRFHYRT